MSRGQTHIGAFSFQQTKGLGNTLCPIYLAISTCFVNKSLCRLSFNSIFSYFLHTQNTRLMFTMPQKKQDFEKLQPRWSHRMGQVTRHKISYLASFESLWASGVCFLHTFSSSFQKRMYRPPCMCAHFTHQVMILFFLNDPRLHEQTSKQTKTNQEQNFIEH